MSWIYRVQDHYRKLNDKTFDAVGYGPWQVEYACFMCFGFLTHREVFYNDGMCIHCGDVSHSTFVTHEKITRRKAYGVAPTLFDRIFKGKKTPWVWEYA